MSTPFEQFAERIANKMIADMKTGVSIFPVMRSGRWKMKMALY